VAPAVAVARSKASHVRFPAGKPQRRGTWCRRSGDHCAEQALDALELYGGERIAGRGMANEAHLAARPAAPLQREVDFESQPLNAARTRIRGRVFEQILDVDPDARHIRRTV
jgi:hypothetical protein